MNVIRFSVFQKFGATFSISCAVRRTSLRRAQAEWIQIYPYLKIPEAPKMLSRKEIYTFYLFLSLCVCSQYLRSAYAYPLGLSSSQAGSPLAHIPLSGFISIRKFILIGVLTQML
jgi:hypothetical protein